jgi:hypothetical protein
MKRNRIIAATRAVNATLDQMLAAAATYEGNVTVDWCKRAARHGVQVRAVRIAKGAIQRKGARVCGGQADLWAMMRLRTELE